MKQKFETRVTDLLGIEHPIVCGGMTTVGRAELAAAVSNAGALGMITALTTGSPENQQKQMAKTRDSTDQHLWHSFHHIAAHQSHSFCLAS